jgi:Holliday junction DNA helicase RuvA
MICSLKGKIESIRRSFVELDVGGVGYLVFVGDGFIRRHQIGEEVKVHTFMAVSENEQALYGFETADELDIFKMLISVSGVGPKTGAQILGSTDSGEIIKAIGDADVDYFKKIKGIGLKTAQRIIVDLKSKIGGLGVIDLASSGGGNGADEKDELYMSLKQLGFDKKEIETVAKKVPPEMVSIEDRLGWCLKNIGM